jgi:photosystem II stability/assembly factor-like uncharacterized protein
MLALCTPARAQVPSASPSAATKPKGSPKASTVSLHKPAPHEDADVELESMKLVAPGTGWAEVWINNSSGTAHTLKVVYRTTDNGKHWRNITPPVNPKDDLSDLFFLDTHHGWAIFERPEEEEQAEEVAKLSELHLTLATTVDAGATWSKTLHTMKLGNYFSKEELPTLDTVNVSRIAFVDQLHGWLQLSYFIGMHGQGSLLLTTSDGGETWRDASNYPGPSSADMLLVTPSEAWVFGTVDPNEGGNSLFVTRDDAKTWQELSASLSESDSPKEWHEMLVRPLGESQATNCDVYDLPMFQDPSHGFFEEDCKSYETDVARTTVLFATTDGGRTWKADRTLRNFAGSCNSSTVVDSVWLAPVKQRGHLVLLHIKAGATLDAGKDNGSNSDDSPLCGTRLSFVTPAQGWMVADGVLSSTIDGGRTWTTITPSSGRK